MAISSSLIKKNPSLYDEQTKTDLYKKVTNPVFKTPTIPASTKTTNTSPAMTAAKKAVGTASNALKKTTTTTASTKTTNTSPVTTAVKKAVETANNALKKTTTTANTQQNDIISQELRDAYSKQFKMSQNTIDAMNKTKELLGQIQAGKTSYSDKIASLMDQISNRDSFTYDPSKDAMWQNALSQAMASGQTAMQDTMGQAAALTGGYGSSYATSAAAQQYNNMIQDAYANLPQYYQMAYQQYQDQGNAMYDQLSAYGQLDSAEYDRLLNSYNAQNNSWQQLYQQDLNNWQNGVNQAFQIANLNLNEAEQNFNMNMTNKNYELNKKEAEANLEYKKTQTATAKKQLEALQNPSANYDALSDKDIEEIKQIYLKYGADSIDSYLDSRGLNIDRDKLAQLFSSMGLVAGNNKNATNANSIIYNNMVSGGWIK